MVPPRVSLLTVGARNLPELRAFYQRLGWAETGISSGNYAVFQTTGVLLALYPLPDLLADMGLPEAGVPSGFKGITFAINVDRPEDVDVMIAEIREAGGRIVREPGNAFWGGRIAYFLDPEDNAWEVAWNPSAVFDERGAMLSF